MALKPQASEDTPPLFNDILRVGAAPEADNQSEDIEEFEDATDDEHLSQGMELLGSFEDCEVAIRKFFNNDLNGAMSMMTKWHETSLYHSLGASIFEFIPAMLTFDPQLISRTITTVKMTIAICNQYRRSYSFVESLSTIIKKPNYAVYTDLEAHAELCYAEALLLQAAITIMDGEDLAGFLKGTIKVKSCYSSYKECMKILEKKEWNVEKSRIHFQSGVRLGMATFNVMLSLLPPKIISLLEFVGFSANKALGLAELEAGSKDPGLRSIICDLTLLAYHLVISHFIGMPGNLHVAENILQKQLQVYPDSVWFMMFKGRLELMRGHFELAAATYFRAIHSQNQWLQFRHVCYWEIMWVESLQMNWREAANYANKLIEESSWSRTIYSYSKAAMMLQLDDDLSHIEKKQCRDLMKNASQFKQRIAGKSLPMEKFVIKRCARYDAQGGRLVLPAIELLCLWNMFHVLAKNHRRMQAVLTLIEKTRETIEGSRFDWMGSYEADNRALVRYLHGCCLAAMNLPRLAIDTLESVSLLKSEIKEDTYLMPYAYAEMAMCHYQLGDKDRALQMLLDVRKRYSGYSLESRLHFRLHSKIQLVKSGVSIVDQEAGSSTQSP